MVIKARRVQTEWILSCTEEIHFVFSAFWEITGSRYVVSLWEIIADNLIKAGWGLDCVSAIDSNGRTIWIADAHRDNGKRFVVHADEKLTAFLELESATRACGGFH